MSRSYDVDHEAERAKALVRRLARQPKSNDTMPSTWNPPDWEEIVAWWDQFVQEARDMTGESYLGR